MRLASWNVNSLRVRLDQVLDWIGRVQPDALALQETKVPDAKFPADAFRLLEQPERVFSWWDYRAAAFRRNLGLRIDLALCSKALGSQIEACYVDVGPRKLDRPSDHAPVVAEFASN